MPNYGREKWRGRTDDRDVTPPSCRWFLHFVLATPSCCGQDNVVSVAARHGLERSMIWSLVGTRLFVLLLSSPEALYICISPVPSWHVIGWPLPFSHNYYEIWDFHSSEYVEDCPLGCDTLQSVRNLWTFQGTTLPSSLFCSRRPLHPQVGDSIFLQRVSKFQPKSIPPHPSGQYSVYQGCINLKCQVTWATKFIP